MPLPSDWSEDVKDLVKGMLTKDPLHRIDMSSLRVSLWWLLEFPCADLAQVHTWVTAGGAEPLPSTEEVSPWRLRRSTRADAGGG